MSALVAPSAARPPVHPGPPSTPLNAAAGPSPRTFLVGCARILLVPLAGMAALLTGWALATPVVSLGWPAAVAAAAGWSMAVAAWLCHLGWPAATAHLTAWAAPTALLAPLAALGWLSAAGLILWWTATALLAMALAAVYSPDLVHQPPRACRTR